MLHLDGSVHEWFTLEPEARPCLIAVSDDATKRVLHAALYPSESTPGGDDEPGGGAAHRGPADGAVHGPGALGVSHAEGEGPGRQDAADPGRAGRWRGWASSTSPSYSPQARGRSERLNRTFQDRLVNELRVAGIATLEAANRYLAERFVPQHNATFARAPRDPASAFVALGAADLDAILCHEEARVVARDNTVSVSAASCRSPRSLAAAVVSA